MKTKDNPIITVDKNFQIEIDGQNWMVWQQREITRGKNKGEIGWTDVGYCRDLPSALKRIMVLKSKENLPTSSVEHYLSWYDSTIHSMCDRILRQEKALKEAIEKNKVMHSYHNVN